MCYWQVDACQAHDLHVYLICLFLEKLIKLVHSKAGIKIGTLNSKCKTVSLEGKYTGCMFGFNFFITTKLHWFAHDRWAKLWSYTCSKSIYPVPGPQWNPCKREQKLLILCIVYLIPGKYKFSKFLWVGHFVVLMLIIRKFNSPPPLITCCYM